VPKTAKKELTAIEVNRLTAKGLHAIGGVTGLYLQVIPPARSWILRIKIGAKRRDIGLGGFPTVTLAKARDKARETRDLVDRGVDPVLDKRRLRSEQVAAQAKAKTFRQCAGEYIESHEAGWKNTKHAQQWRNTLEQHAYPVLGDLLVGEVEKVHVLRVLQPLWTTKSETASRIRSRIELVLSYAMQSGYRPEVLNPARWKGGLDAILPAPSKVSTPIHHPALPLSQMNAFMQRLRQVEGSGARALEFTILTAARSGEVRGASWSEIALDGRVWTVPAQRMKAKKEHRVPLSAESTRLLKALPRAVGSDLVFPARGLRQLSDMTLNAVLRRMDVAAVPHGFRSTFRDWAGETTAHPREVIEQALAHKLKNKSEAAYARGDLFNRRANLMAEWGQFCYEPPIHQPNAEEADGVAI